MINDPACISDFWHEVTETITRLFSEQDEETARLLITDYQDRLKRIDENLTFHFERDEGTECVEMVIGCDGYAQSIGSVLSLVEAAPSIEGLKVVAFNGRHDPVPPYICVGEDDFHIDEFWCSLRQDSGKLHLSVYLEESAEPEPNPRVEAVMIFLDAILGEYDLMTRVSTLNWYERPFDPEDHGLLPFRDLRGRFDMLRTDLQLIGATLH